MSEKQRFPRAAALEVARDLVRHLEPVTTKLIVAGSLRRRKMDVGDVEIVYIPRTVERPIDLVTTAPVDLAAECLERLIDQGLLAKRKNTKGSTMWGQMNKLAVHVASGIPVDLFATMEQCWHNYLVCRTGPASSNGEIAKRAIDKGWHWQPYGVGFRRENGDVHPVTSEREVFEFVGLEYREPWERL